jgi:Fe-S cluster assembly protein SufD
MIQLSEENDVFPAGFQRLERRFREGSPPWLESLRRAAAARFAELGLPTTRDEEWRFTKVAPLAGVPFEPVGSEPGTLAPDQFDRVAPLPADRPRAVLVDGRYSPELSSAGRLPEGVTLMSLAEALRTQPESIEPRLGKNAVYREHAFVALNTAMVEDGVFLYVPRGVVVEEPIHLVHVWTASGEPRMTHPRNLIVLDRHAAATVVESYRSEGEGVDFTNAVSEVFLYENSSLAHFKVQRESRRAFHFATTHVRQERDSSFLSQYVSLGGALVRNETNVLLAGENCQATLDGLYVASGTQHVDSRTRIDHAKPHCTSHELYKGILDGRAEGVFSGKIFVHPDAQKTDARQTNQALLLSDDAVINTKPQLEIFADDVKCTHGATVGQLDRESLFYLRSRGIPQEKARDLLVYAFANDVVRRIVVPEVRAELEETLLSSRGLPVAELGEEGL